MKFRIGQPMRQHEDRNPRHETRRARAANLIDYSMAQAGDPPQFDVSFMVILSKASPLGMDECVLSGSGGGLPTAARQRVG
jgi:hypothetical protein